MAEFMTREQLKKLKSHKYISEGKSYLEKYVLRHLWDYLVELLPMSVAPNLLTLIGVVFMVIPFIGMMLTNSDAKTEDAPGCWYFAMAIGLFIFQQLDNLDGRQARRTNSSSTLGEFFDHGLDGISDSFMLLACVIALQVGNFPNLFFVMGLIIVQDYCFYWRAHWTGKYVFGDFDISEFQWLIIAVLTTTGISKKLLAIQIFGLFELQTFLVYLYFFLTLYYLGDVWIEAIRIGILDPSGDPEMRRNVLAPMYPLAINAILAILVRHFTNVYEQYPVAFLTLYILIVAKMACRLLVANMTKSRMAPFDTSMLSFCFLFLTNTSIAPALIQISPSAALFIGMSFATVEFVKYMIVISLQMADFFNVNCLSLAPRPARNTED